MRKTLVPLVLLGAVCGHADAMRLNHNGLGEVLVFPYYTVNGGNQTQITLANRTGAGKALRLRFLEGMNGREVFSVNVYLGDHDMWTAAVFSLQEGGAATLITQDTSCTVPAIRTSTTLPQLADGRRIAPFGNASYTGNNDDAGPDTLLRTREGYFEVIEMGEVVNATRTSLRDISESSTALPANCPGIVAAWDTGGYWTQAPDVDMQPPRGGIAAQAAIVDTENGTMLAYSPAAIVGFSPLVQNTAPGGATPNLASGGDGQSVIDVAVNTYFGADTFRYSSARAVDAMSALLMQTTVMNEFATSAGVGGVSEWVLSFPTKKFYTDDALVGAAVIKPFTRLFSSVANGSGATTAMPLPVTVPAASGSTLALAGESFDFALWDREGRGYNNACLGNPDEIICAFFAPPINPPSTLDWATNVLSINQADMAPSRVLGSLLRVDINAQALGLAGDGRMHLDFAGHIGFGYLSGTFGHWLPPSSPGLGGSTLFGLPVLGFWAMSVTNTAVTPGVLANYAMQVPHRGYLMSLIEFGAQNTSRTEDR
jgi:hypothetical protein